MNPSTNYTKLPVVTDGTQCRINGGYRTFRFVIHEAGPNHDPFASLLAESSVIDGRPKEPVNLLLSHDSTVYVDGLGVHKIMRGNHSDHARLIPQFGGRFYVHFDGFNSWSIHDRLNGSVIPWDLRRAVQDRLGITVVASIHTARVIAAWLSYQHQIDNYDRS